MLSVKLGRTAKLEDSNYASVILRKLLESELGRGGGVCFSQTESSRVLVGGLHGILPHIPKDDH